MKQFYVCLLLILGMHAAIAQVRISMLVPKPNQLLNNKVFVEGYAASSAGAITSVKASINSQEVTMNISQLAYFFGDFNLSALPVGPLQLHIIATDALQNQLDTVINIIRDTPPQVVLELPVSETVARPLLRVKAYAVDNGPVNRMEVRFRTRTYTFNSASIDTVFDASAEEAPLNVYAIDSAGQQGFATASYSVNINPGLESVITLPPYRNIQDYNYGKVFAAKPADFGAYNPTNYLYDVPGGSETLIPGNIELSTAQQQLKRAWVTPQGAYFTGRYVTSGSTGDLTLFEWWSAQLTPLQTGVKRVNVTGKYAVWISTIGDSLFLHDQAAQTKIFLEKGVTHADVDSTGRVDYIVGASIYRYNNGTTSLVVSDDGPLAQFPYLDSDSDDIAYFGISPYKVSGLFLHTDTSNTRFVMSGDYPELVVPYLAERIRLKNHHLVFTRHQSSYLSETWFYRKSPGDTLKLLKRLTKESKFGSDVLGYIRGVNAQGDVLLWEDPWPSTNTGKLVYYPVNGPSKTVTELDLSTYDINGEWYGSLANTLYKLSLDTAYGAEAIPFTKPLLINQSGRFSLKDFTSHFSGPEYGPGQLMEVKITRLPTWGILVHPNGSQVGITGQVLKRSELEGLRYVPYQNVIGADTIRWAGYNGNVWSNQAAITLMTHPNLTAPPKLAGLDSSYCDTVTADVIKITNYPPVKWRTTVTVLLDGTTILPVGADSTFTIYPTAGTHTLKVTFRHPLDSISTTASFRTVSCPSGGGRLEEIADKLKDVEILTAYPNPFTTQFTVKGLNAAKRYTYSLHDLQGNVVYTGLVNNQTTVVITPNATLKKGIYYLKVFDVALNKTTAVAAVVKM
ncbi:T9SS type A sorting domain-containing protein [uncultured Chitinophaga sp.]|uniref:T9SS type A sorting domain-containing protein n=1 Tax=uncultured Chitinophaga sp. TaxID=339340 RepID=UPI0025CFB5F8|nr:T9SS type A sorting domain-containing protein [uncultured Chitinophaga sp.]